MSVGILTSPDQVLKHAHEREPMLSVANAGIDCILHNINRSYAAREQLTCSLPGALYAGVLYPIDWRKGPPVCNPRTSEYNFLRCLAKYPDAYAITFWLHSWQR